MSNVSVVVNYEGHGPYDSPGYMQFTRSGDSVFVVVDGRPVGTVSAEEFSRVERVCGAGRAPAFRSAFPA